jgi:hypothetical protein
MGAVFAVFAVLGVVFAVLGVVFAVLRVVFAVLRVVFAVLRVVQVGQVEASSCFVTSTIYIHHQY